MEPLPLMEHPRVRQEPQIAVVVVAAVAHATHTPTWQVASMAFISEQLEATEGLELLSSHSLRTCLL
jgi:hypothetical protein